MAGPYCIPLALKGKLASIAEQLLPHGKQGQRTSASCAKMYPYHL